jgi:hypothetical protein
MNKIHAIIHKASRSVHLDPHTKAGFRRTLEALTESPEAVPAVARFPRALAWALAAVVVASTGATATYASTRALPGETLYSVKVNVLEPAEEAFALTADAKAEVALAHIERRYREAAELSAAGSLAAYDEMLAAQAAIDVAKVDRDDQPVARARFQAFASVYGPSLLIEDVAASRFAAAVRLGDANDRVSDDMARIAAEKQLAVALQKGAEARKGAASLAVSARLQRVDQLSRAANMDLNKGAYQAALKLSGAAAQAAAEAKIFAEVADEDTATSTDETSTTTTSTSVTATSSATTSVERKKAPATKAKSPVSPDTDPPSGAGGILQGLLN